MPSFFIPARNSRHRTACFALYRALLRQAPRIQLPDDIVAARRGPVDPITHLIRRAFRRNRADTSPRIVYPALKAGYQILALLRSAASSPAETSTSIKPTKASESTQTTKTRKSSKTATAPNADYNAIISLLRARLAERTRSLIANPTPPSKPSSARHPNAIPLLINVAPSPTPTNPNPPPKYISPTRPRPLPQLGGSGRRQIPRLEMASDFPFLRLKKPQPTVLSHVLHQKIKKRQIRTETLIRFREDSIPDAELEDEWENILADTMEKWDGGNSNTRRAGRAGRSMAQEIRKDLKTRNTFRETISTHGLRYMEDMLTRERLDLIARADAMRGIIEEETRMAAWEKEQRRTEKRKRWEAKMLELHGEGWQKQFPNLEENKARI
ncbi:uncharacterized protein F4822DRAFT_405658 [Hypoxylon trugodes]|uniref:uncharacterized protein n=1 Tax=Hypoxylon trugodes TaxID=326681 RepID=UPI002195E8D0|nr:uncharacterized protein F4822DRAFT_405658 [Hypoxylon trugodes]KAI1387173.1 hypothetical protein F4822DRAFT_405658 [Hypoxylon trugodes]